MSRLFYNIRQAIQQIFRNFAMSLTSLLAITAMMLILGLFFVISVNVNLFTESVKEDYDTVEVYLEDKVSAEEAQAIMDKLGKLDGVSNVQYRTKEQALKIMKKRWGESGYLLDSLGKNPMPNSILVKVSDLKSADHVNTEAEKISGVESTKYYRETVNKLTRLARYMQIGAIVIMLFLVVVSVIVVSNTIKLTVFARAREISIMRYVGATNWFIRGPFLIEGIIIGIISSLIAAFITYFLYGRLVDAVGLKVMTLLSTPMVPAGYLAYNLIIIFLAMGISIGACGSIISMRRFLRA